jgi:hypothetical protein
MIVIGIIGIIAYIMNFGTFVGTLICDSNDVSCAAWTHKDVLSKCDSFCKGKMGESFSHSQHFKINADGSVDCECVANTTTISTPSINVPAVKRSQLPVRAGEVPSIEKLTDLKYDVNKVDQYKRFNKLIFG